MTTAATISARLTLDKSDYDKGLGDADKQASNFQSNMKSVGQSMSRVGGQMTAALTVPVVGAFTAMVTSASDLNESANAMRVVFGESSDAVENFGEKSAEAVGLAKSDWFQLAAVQGAALKNYGFNQEQAGEETIKLATRAADMASIFNTDVNDAMTAIGAMMRGETEPIKRYGVSMSQAAIEAKAMSMGLIETTISMADVESAQSKLGKAGENWFGILDEQLKKGKLTKDQYAELAQATDIIDEAYENAGTGTDEWNAATQSSLDVWRKYSEVVGEDGRGAILGYIDGLEGIDKAMKGSTGEMTQAQKAQAALALFYEQTDQFAGDFANTSDQLANSTRILKAQIKDEAASLGADLLPYVLKAVTYFRELIGKFQQLTPEQKKWIMVIMGVVAVLGPLLMILGSVVTAISAIIPVITAVAGLFTFPLIAVIAAVIAVMALLYAAWQNNWGGIREITADVIQWVSDFIADAMQFITDLTTGQLGEWSAIWDRTVNAIKVVVSTWVTNMKLLWQALKAFLSGDFKQAGQIFRQIWDNTMKALGTVIRTGWENIKSIFSGAVASLKSWLMSINWSDVGKNLVQTIATGLLGAGPLLISAGSKIFSALGDFLSGFFGGGSNYTDPVIPPGYGGGTGDPGAVGTNGWKTVPPGYNDDSYFVPMKSGEQYAIATKNGGLPPGSGGTVNYFNPQITVMSSKQEPRQILRGLV